MNKTFNFKGILIITIYTFSIKYLKNIFYSYNKKN